MLRDAPVLDFSIRRFQEAEIVDARKGGQRRDEADVRAFRRLDRADAAIVRRVDVADFEARAVAAQAARPSADRRVCVSTRQRVDLVHELRHWLRPKKSVSRRKRLRVD